MRGQALVAPEQWMPHHPGAKLEGRREGEERTNSLRDGGSGGGPQKQGRVGVHVGGGVG